MDIHFQSDMPPCEGTLAARSYTKSTLALDSQRAYSGLSEGLSEAGATLHVARLAGNSPAVTTVQGMYLQMFVFLIVQPGNDRQGRCCHDDVCHDITACRHVHHRTGNAVPPASVRLQSPCPTTLSRHGFE